LQIIKIEMKKWDQIWRWISHGVLRSYVSHAMLARVVWWKWMHPGNIAASEKLLILLYWHGTEGQSVKVSINSLLRCEYFSNSKRLQNVIINYLVKVKDWISSKRVLRNWYYWT
jgi:hypothetical protein